MKTLFSTKLTSLGILFLLVAGTAIVSNGTIEHSVVTGSGYAVNLSTDAKTYSGAQTVHITGTVSPPPSSSSTAAFISVTAPDGAQVEAMQSAVSTTGSFTSSFVTGGTTDWTSGAYTIIVSYYGSSGNVTIHWSPSTTYVVSVSTDSSSYTGAQTIKVSGIVSPAPAASNTAALVTISAPDGAQVEAAEAVVSASGSFSVSFVAGGTSDWTSGTYALVASYYGSNSTSHFQWTTSTSTTSTSSSITQVSLTTTTSIAVNTTTVSTKWNPYTDFYNFINYGLFKDGGDCYGFSSTAILYFRHYELGDQTYPFYSEPTASVAAMPGQTLNCVPILGCIGYEYTLSQSTFPIYIHQTYDPNNIGAVVSNVQSSVQLLMQNIRNGIPVIVELGPSEFHAVVAWSYVQYANGSLIIGISDPNFGNTPRYAYYNGGQFSYSGTYNWTTFNVASPGMIQWSWLSLEGIYAARWSSTVSATNSYYNYVFASVPIKILGQSGQASFSAPGDSLTFTNSINGIVGFEEGGIQVYGIPKGIPYTISDPGEAASMIMVVIPQNESSIVGYQLASSSATPLNLNIVPSNDGLNISTVNNVNLSVAFFSIGQNTHSVLNASSIPVASSQTAAFSVPNWGNLNSTTSAANLQVFESNGTKLVSSQTLTNVQTISTTTSTVTSTVTSSNSTEVVTIIVGGVVVAVAGVGVLIFTFRRKVTKP